MTNLPPLARASRMAASLVATALTVLPAMAQPYDPRDDVFYHFMPIAWRNAGGGEFRDGDFDGMTASLDYLQQLGVTGVWINPIHPSPAYHGYQHGPIDQINERFGTEAQFLHFVAEAKKRGIKVYLDVVCYGISQNSTYFKDANKNPASEFDSYLAFTDAGNTQFTGYTFKTWTGESVGFVNWDLRGPRTGSGAGSGKARKLVIDWCKKWLDPNADGDPSDGVAGYRLDHVWRTYNQGPEGWGYNIDDFWMEWKRELQRVNPSVFTFAEQAAWESTGVDLLAAHDAAFTKPFEFAAREAIKSENAAKLYEAMERTWSTYQAVNQGAPPRTSPVTPFPSSPTFLAILGDHDVDRLASSIGADRAETLGRAKVAAAILLLQPFPPIIYYGDEIGMLGVKGNFGSDANDIPMREPMKWNAVAGPPMTNYHARHSGVVKASYSKDRDGRSVEEQQGVAGSLLETYRELIVLRKSTPALARGDYRPLQRIHPSIWGFIRHDLAATTEEDSAVVLINLSSKPVDLKLFVGSVVVPDADADRLRDLRTGAIINRIEPARLPEFSVTIPGYGNAVYACSLRPKAGPKPGVPDPSK